MPVPGGGGRRAGGDRAAAGSPADGGAGGVPHSRLQNPTGRFLDDGARARLLDRLAHLARSPSSTRRSPSWHWTGRPAGAAVRAHAGRRRRRHRRQAQQDRLGWAAGGLDPGRPGTCGGCDSGWPVPRSRRRCWSSWWPSRCWTRSGDPRRADRAATCPARSPGRRLAAVLPEWRCTVPDGRLACGATSARRCPPRWPPSPRGTAWSSRRARGSGPGTRSTTGCGSRSPIEPVLTDAVRRLRRPRTTWPGPRRSRTRPAEVVV
ncbi:hypothetical protein HBB16_03640 [Pseudonocardia sp. MCCB 268]|nr:hypothetical protein [Pseudonocardia cytotoxica]